MGRGENSWKKGTFSIQAKQVFVFTHRSFFLESKQMLRDTEHKREKNNCFAHAQYESCRRVQRQNECACSPDLWFERESITNAPFQSPNSHLLPQYFFCWIRYVVEEVRRNLSWKRQPYLFWFGLIHAKRKQTMRILRMPPFCRVRLLTVDEHAHSFCRCVDSSANRLRILHFNRQIHTCYHNIFLVE